MDLDKIAKLTGEDEVKQAPRYELPIVRFNGNTGKFYKLVPKDDGSLEQIELGDKIKGVMLKVRRRFSAFTKDYRLFTNEHNSWKDNVILFEVRKKADGTIERRMIDSGKIGELREKYPELRGAMKQIIYFLLEPEKEIVKLIIKGKGLSNLFDFWREFDKDEHIFEYITEIGAKEEVNEAGMRYYANTFGRVEKVEDLDFVVKKIQEVAENIQKVEDYYKEVEEEEMEIEEDEQLDMPKKDDYMIRTDDGKTMTPEEYYSQDRPEDDMPIIEEKEDIGEPPF